LIRIRWENPASGFLKKMTLKYGRKTWKTDQLLPDFSTGEIQKPG
jgi:hypothetical protein